MLSSLGRLTARHRWWVVVAAALLAVLGGVWGTGTFGTLTGGAGFDDPHSESVRADRMLAGPLGRQSADVVVLYSSEKHTVDDPAFADPVRKSLDGVPREDIARLETYWSVKGEEGADGARAREFISRDHHATYATVQFTTDGDQDQVAALREIEDRFAVPAASGVTVRFGGTAAMTEQVNARTGADIGRAEMLSLPILMVLLLVVFGSVVAASLPLAVGVLVALGSLVVLRTVSLFTDLSSSVINVITILGLGLAIDYALFMVGRFREELAAGAEVDEAVERTTATAGRTVAFSGLAVAISFTGLTLFPSRFLSSMGYAAVAVVVFAVIGSLTLLPALLRFAGRRVDAGRLPLPRGLRRTPRTHAPGGDERGRWYRLAHTVMRRPLLTTALLTASLLGLAGPAVGVNWARPGDWVLPEGADARQVTRQLGDRFDHDPTKVVTAVVDLHGSAADRSGRLAGYAERLGAVEGVKDAAVTATRGKLVRITLHYTPDPMSREARTMVEELRAQTPPPGTEARFTGMPASRVDIVDMIGERALWMGLFVAVVSALVLFLAFRSLAIPLITVAMSALSLLAAFGVITLIFQYGVGAGPLGFEAIGAVDANFPVLIVAIAFGLAMDYQVFLLSRVRERYLATGDPAESTATALQRTAGTITGAGLLLAVVVGGFAFSSITFLKMIGIGLILAIALDVLVVRALMLPAVLGLLGHRAWRGPAPSRADHRPVPSSLEPQER
ncbi:MMPL domain-containing protein [Streptomyces bingchenggensis BCW-1]|uniref:MMPL domain-containing protein n=1 Tax=Streptomyces bingchenggensis (strain BCW-1) TaxID=749414 RepID=D7C6V7_STRBB|nr:MULTISPECIES: MMPL family transporter [Streptomyces]ADI08344.1 MMPL domain-containing protein [Streptomyces bingchenggensis BCW-1]